MRSFFGFAMVLLVAFASACLWDSDTMGAELKGLPGIQDIIAGRIDRNPDLYYEMRLERCQTYLGQTDEKLLANARTTFAVFDDGAVALDRLGRQDEAIAWMNRKKLLTDRVYHSDLFHRYSYLGVPGRSSVDLDSLLTEPNRKEKAEVDYRTYANRGTFYAHRGVKTGNAKDFDLALADLDRALKINPDAHFGREHVQVQVIKWYRDPAAKPKEEIREMSPDELRKMREGLEGILVLGDAWNNPDILYLLSWTLSKESSKPVKSSVLESLAKRAEELRDENPQKAYRYIDHMPMGHGYTDAVAPINENAYVELRKNGDAYRKNRTEFMMTKLRAGKHPDTHDDFWEGYREEPPVSSNALNGNLIQRINLAFEKYHIGIWLIFVTVVSFTIWVLSRIRKWRTRRIAG